ARRARQPLAELLPLEEAGGVVLDPLPDDDLAADRHEVEHAADRIAGGAVGQFFLAPAQPGKRAERRRLGRPHEVEFADPLDIAVAVVVEGGGGGHEGAAVVSSLALMS